ncbi:PQQ-dependent sugar dehydrogenase [Ulvibacter antarcticus]|uniref:Putative secreted protein (Por secretion system target) n=1 Tax=Ulvibacter antarcticus TaxID=442714 RepID=A0A3L9Z0L4_9FLAO|nr:PQQ-dependent sugar dehydrogenase [Ulvibacter antarcticus]RMA64919.1 putative secreted protein (Por secretion system target) [Ulvibacter antarcticus]
MKNLLFSLFFIFFSFTISAQDIDIELITSGFSNPIDIQNAGDDRLFIAEQGGRIKILNPDGTVNPTPFLNISTLVSGGSEQGLLGLAFHPDYASNGYFFVNYTKTNGDTRIARYTVDPSDPDVVLAGSQLTIIEYDQPFGNHNGGGIAFGPDGYLYIATGDGGSGGDPGNRAQNTTLLLGKLLRLNIDIPAGGNNYSIPADNPFFGSSSQAQEIWAYGLRNPWRFSFDSENGDLWIGDVGQGDWEEIDKAGLTEAGINYGWRCYEGNMPYNTTGCPPVGDLTFPIAEYSSGPGSPHCSITGGIVYRGTAQPTLIGHYFFGDVCSGMIGSIAPDGTLTDHGTFGGSWVGFGVDINQELYVLSHGGNFNRVVEVVVAGVSDFDTAQITMVPNPASEVIAISIENDRIQSIRITDMKGSTLFSEDKLTSEKDINIGGYESGLYLVNIVTENGNSTTKKLLIE